MIQEWNERQEAASRRRALRLPERQPGAIARKASTVRLRTYKAFSYDQAITAAKQDLGAGVRVVQTRQVRQKGLIGFWLRPVVELTVQLPSEERAPQNAPAKSQGASAAYAQSQQTTSEAPLDMELERAKTQRLAQALAAKLEREGRVRRHAERNERAVAGTAQLQQAIDNATQSQGRSTAQGRRDSTPKVAAAPPADVARRYVLRQDGASDQRIQERAALLGDTSVTPSPASRVGSVDPIQRVVSQAVEEERSELGAFGRDAHATPAGLRTIYTRLIEQAVTEELADQLIVEMAEELGDEGCEDSERIRRAAERRIAALLPVDDQSFDRTAARQAGRPHLVALIGPTGVGKTTTIAKLAATCRFRDGLSVGLVTTDSFRMAAVDQLRSYADILQVPLEVVIEPEEMKDALDRLGSCDVVLIDSAGRSRRDEERLDVLRQFLDEAEPDETHLVLSATSGERTMLRDADAFAPLGADRVVLTKLDETDDFGIVLNVIHRLGTRISFVTTGQEVPDDIERGGSDRIARSLLAGVLKEKPQAPTECEPVP